MNKVKTNLFALAAGVLISPALMAADIDGPSVERTYSNELLSTAVAADTVAGDILSVQLGSEYANFDEILLSFSGAALDDSTLPTSAVVAPGSLGGGDGAGVTLGLVDQSPSFAIYRVTEISPCDDGGFPGCDNTTVGVVVPIAAADVLEFNAIAVDAANVITVVFSATRFGGGTLDTGGGDARTIDYIETDDQYAAEVDVAFNQVVDVDQDRKGFVVGLDDTSTITLSNSIFPPFGAAAVDFGAVWEGDFSWIIDVDEDPSNGIQPGMGVVASDCVTDLAITPTSITHKCSAAEKPGGSGSTFLTLDPSAQGNTETLPQTTFTVTVTANFTGFGDPAVAGTAEFGASAGRWRLNGFQALIPYMPFGANIGQVIYLVNRGSQSGDVTVDYTDQNGMQASLGVIATLPATSTLKLGQLIQNALPASLKSSGRLGLTVTANVRAEDVQINSQYNVSGNRAFTLHEDNRPIETVDFGPVLEAIGE